MENKVETAITTAFNQESAAGGVIDVPSSGDEQKSKEKKENKEKKKEKIEVGVRLTVQNISEINTASQVFTCRFKIKLVWFASDEDIESWENGGKDNIEWIPPSFAPAIHWQNALTPPDISLKDERDRYYEIQKKLDKNSGRKICAYDFSAIGTFTETFELKSFPFDIQDMSIFMKLQNKGASARCNFVPDFTTKEFSKFQLSNTVTTEWTIHPPMIEFGWTDKRASKEGKQYSLFVAKFKMERNSNFYLSRVCVYLAMLSFLSLTAFAIGVGDVGDRLGVNFTMLLAIIAYQLVCIVNCHCFFLFLFLFLFFFCALSKIKTKTNRNNILLL